MLNKIHPFFWGLGLALAGLFAAPPIGWVFEHWADFWRHL